MKGESSLSEVPCTSQASGVATASTPEPMVEDLEDETASGIKEPVRLKT